MTNIGFLFPGQGAQFVGMGRELIEQVEPAKQLFDQANEVLGYDLIEICLNGPPETLQATEHSQPALFVTSMAALEKLKVEDAAAIDSCAMTAGLSLGEYSALCFADVLSFADGLRLVRERGLAMQAAADANPSGMVAILGLEESQIADLCDQARGDEVLQIANLLCPGNIVCSGSHGACERLGQLAEQANAMKVIPLTVAGAFHTSLMQSAVERLATALQQAEFAAARIPIVSNVDAKAHTDPGEIRDLLLQQIVHPVRWEQSVRTMLDAGLDAFYEVGAGKVLRGLMKRIHRKTPVTNV